MFISIKSTWIAVCLFSGIFLLSCKDNKDRWFPIANDCAMVAKVDPVNLSKKIVLDKLGDFNIADFFDFSPKDTSVKKGELSTIIDDPSGVGIDLLDDIYIFKKDKLVGFIASLKDEGDFSDHLQKSLKKEILSYQEYRYTKVDSFIISWNREHCIFLIKEDLSSINNTDLENILKLKREESIFQQNNFLQAEDESSDIFLWFSIPKLLQDHPLSSLTDGILNKDYSSAYISFDDGKIIVKAKDFLSPVTAQLLANPRSEINPHFNSIKSGNSIAMAAIHLDMKKGLEFVQSYSSKKHFEKAGLSERDLDETFTGELLINFSDLTELKKVYSSYTYDEDFNKIEVSDTIKIIQPIYSVFIGVLDSVKSEKILNGLYSKRLIDKQVDHYTFTLSDFPVNFYNTKEGVIISNQNNPQEKETSLETEIDKDLFSHSFMVYGNPSKFFPLIKEQHRTNIPLDEVQKAIVKISKGENNSYILNSEIYLNNTDKNSLLTLIDLFKTKQQSAL